MSITVFLSVASGIDHLFIKYFLNHNYKFFQVLAILIWDTGISSALEVKRIKIG